MQKTAKIKTQHKISDMPTMKNCPMKISFALSSILFIPFAAEAFAPSFASDRSASSVSSAIRPGQSSTNLNSLPTSLDTLTSGLASISRIQYGVTVAPNRVSLTGPAAFYLPKLKILYDVENSRACRSVRERITELDLAVDKVIPSAKNSRVMNGGLEGVEKPSIVPTLVAIVEGKEQKFQGEDQILGFLNEKFSNEKKISKIKPLAPLTDLESIEETESSAEVENAVTQIKEILSDLTKYLPGLLRPSRGTKVASPASFTLPNVPRPRKPLILYSYEGNQFCRLVREILTELDLPYELRSAGKGSFRREELSEITGGSSQCPYLIDPNTEIRMPESKDIIQYLYDTYALWTPPSELLRLASAVVTPLLAPLYKLITPLQAGSYRENEFEYRSEIAEAKAEIFDEISTAPVVIYTYELSPFCIEATNLLDNIGVRYKKVSLGREWIPGLIDNPAKRAALLEITGQSSLPNVFIGGTSIGGLYSGKPGIIPALEKGIFMDLVEDAKRSM